MDAIGRTYRPDVLSRPGAMNAMYTVCIIIQEAERKEWIILAQGIYR